jgi:CBS domain-containing protein
MGRKLSDILAVKGAEVRGVTSEATVLDAVHVMNEHRIGAVLVLADGDSRTPVGIFSERDVLQRVIQKGLDPADTPVSRVMTEDVLTVPPTVTVDQAMAVVTETRCRHLPVMDGDRLLGLVSSGDLTREVTRGQKFEIRQLINYITSKYPA